MSHQTGATFFTLSAHIIEFTAIWKLWIATQIANEQTPTFHPDNRIIFLDIEASMSMQARKLAMGTRGYVESMLRIHIYETEPVIYADEL